jgi:hypothetical protein
MEVREPDADANAEVLPADFDQTRETTQIGTSAPLSTVDVHGREQSEVRTLFPATQVLDRDSVIFGGHTGSQAPQSTHSSVWM